MGKIPAASNEEQLRELIREVNGLLRDLKREKREFLDDLNKEKHEIQTIVTSWKTEVDNEMTEYVQKELDQLGDWFLRQRDRIAEFTIKEINELVSRVIGTSKLDGPLGMEEQYQLTQLLLRFRAYNKNDELAKYDTSWVNIAKKSRKE
jgi:hypothetical protein